MKEALETGVRSHGFKVDPVSEMTFCLLALIRPSMISRTLG